MDFLIFSEGKLTILGGQELVFALKIRALVIRNHIVDRTCGYIGDLCDPVVPSDYALFYILWCTKRACGCCCTSQAVKNHRLTS